MKFTTLLLAATTSASFAVAQEDCTSTLSKVIQFDLSPTTTIYQTTITDIAEVDCDGCDYVEIKNLGGIGPVRKITATVTQEVTTTTETVCAVTPY